MLADIVRGSHGDWYNWPGDNLEVGMGMLVVGRPKKALSDGTGPEPKTIGFRVSGEYGEWLKALAKANRTTLTGVMDRAIAEWASSQGFEPPAPERLP